MDVVLAVADMRTVVIAVPDIGRIVVAPSCACRLLSAVAVSVLWRARAVLVNMDGVFAPGDDIVRTNLSYSEF